MRPRWSEFLRMLDRPRSNLFEDGSSLAMQLGGSLATDVTLCTQRLVLGACRAAAATLDGATDSGVAASNPAAKAAVAPGFEVRVVGPRAVDLYPSEDMGSPVSQPLVVVDETTTARAFATLSEDLDASVAAIELLNVFHPTAILYEADPRRPETTLLGLRDSTRRATLQGMTAMGEYHGNRRFNALGDVVFVPPAVRGHVRARSAWLRKTALDLPSWRESGGPFWRLGRYNLWRLDVLGWAERLALGALVGTDRRIAVVLGPRHLFPRVGFVPETARQMGRTLIGVPFEAVPEPLRAAAERARERLMSRRAQVFMGLEAFL